MPRIVQIVADGRPGGGTTAVLTLSRLLSEDGIDVVVATQRQSYLAAEAATAGLTVVGLDFARRSSTIRLALQLSRLFRKCAPAVVHAHGARAGLPVALASLGMAHRLVYTVHGFHFRHKGPVARRLARAAEAVCIRAADCTVFVSDADLRIARTSGLLARSRAQRVIKNAVRLDTPQGERQQRFDIGFVGRLHPQKNPLILVDILKAMRPLTPSLCVVGGGELAGELQARVCRDGLRGQVTLCGERERGEAIELLSTCRALVLPSCWEGHPVTLIEAMYLGVPAVASDIPGNDEIVAPGETGYLVPAADAAGYAACLTRLLADDMLRARLAAQGRRRAEREYSPARLLNAYLETYGTGGAQSPVASQGMRA